MRKQIDGHTPPAAANPCNAAQLVVLGAQTERRRKVPPSRFRKTHRAVQLRVMRSCAKIRRPRPPPGPAWHGNTVPGKSQDCTQKRFKKSIRSLFHWRRRLKHTARRWQRPMKLKSYRRRIRAMRLSPLVLTAYPALAAAFAAVPVALHRPLGDFGRRFDRCVACALRLSGLRRTVHPYSSNRAGADRTQA
jgi:hypothetical protein